MEIVVHVATSMINVEQALQRIRCSPEATATGFIRFPVPGTAIYSDQKSPSTSTTGELNSGFPKHGCSTGCCNLFRCLQICCVFLLFNRFSLACAAVESLTSTFVCSQPVKHVRMPKGRGEWASPKACGFRGLEAKNSAATVATFPASRVDIRW